jgi:hypothetical protein
VGVAQATLKQQLLTLDNSRVSMGKSMENPWKNMGSSAGNEDFKMF